MVMRLLAFGFAAQVDVETLAVTVRGAVGDGAGLELLAFLEQDDLPDPEDVLADPGGFVVPDRGDRVQATLSAMVDAVRRRPTLHRWTAGWAVLARTAATQPVDLLVSAAMDLAALRESDWALPGGLEQLGPVLDLLAIADAPSAA